MTFSFDVNFSLLSQYFNCGNKTKSLGTNSGKYGGFINNLNFNSLIFAIENAQVSSCVLSLLSEKVFPNFLLNRCKKIACPFQVIHVDDFACIPKIWSHRLVGLIIFFLFGTGSPLKICFNCFLSLECNVSPQLYIYDSGKVQTQPPNRSQDCIYSSRRPNSVPILRRVFSHPIYRVKLKTLYLLIFPWSDLFRAL